MSRLARTLTPGDTPPRERQIEGTRVSVATPAALYRLKKGTVRPKDHLRHCARYWAIAPRTYPRGVFKFRSIEEAQHARERHQP